MNRFIIKFIHCNLRNNPIKSWNENGMENREIINLNFSLIQISQVLKLLSFGTH